VLDWLRRGSIVIGLKGSEQCHDLKDKSCDKADPDHALDENATPVVDT
jgi:hypothetical protein